MSIRIDNITRGRFGNKILQYNTLMQIATNNNIIPSCCYWEEKKYFKNIINYTNTNLPKKILFCKDIIENKSLDFKNFSYHIDDPAYCLHNIFYYVSKTDPRFFLELKDEYKQKLDENILNIGIHIRGDDIISRDGNNGREIHEFEYYKNCINNVILHNNSIDCLFHICTDDTNFTTYLDTLSYLNSKKLNYMIGPSNGNKNNFIYDFSLLSECDILINSSSTFAMCAGFLGKKDKQIIHSKIWIEKNINHTPWNNKTDSQILDYNILDFRNTFDNFWIDVSKKNTFDNFYYATNII